MRTSLWGLAALTLGVAGAWPRLAAEEPRDPPVGPLFVRVESAGRDVNGAGEKLLTCFGKVIKEQETVNLQTGARQRVVVESSVKEGIPLNRVVVTTAAGKPADGGPGWRSLVGRTVVVLRDGVPLDPAVARRLAPDTLVITERQEGKK